MKFLINKITVLITVIAVALSSLPMMLFAASDDSAAEKPAEYQVWMKNYANDIELTSGYGYTYNADSGVLNINGVINGSTAWPKVSTGIRLDLKEEYVFEFDVCQVSGGSSNYFRPVFFDSVGGDNYSGMLFSSQTAFNCGVYKIGNPINYFTTDQGSTFTMTTGSTHHMIMYFKEGNLSFWVDDALLLDNSTITYSGNSILEFAFSTSDNEINVSNIKIYDPSQTVTIPTMPEGNNDYAEKITGLDSDKKLTLDGTATDNYKKRLGVNINVNDDYVWEFKLIQTDASTSWDCIRPCFFAANTAETGCSMFNFSRHAENTANLFEFESPSASVECMTSKTFKPSLNTEYKFVIQFAGGKLLLWIDGEIYIDGTAVTLSDENKTEFEIGFALCRSKVVLSDIHVYKTGRDTTPEADEPQVIPTMPEGAVNYAENMSVNTSLVPEASYENGVLTSTATATENFVVFNNVSFASTDTFVYEVTVNTTEADVNWKGFRPTLFDSNYNSHLAVSLFSDIFYLVKTGAGNMAVSNGGSDTAVASRELNRDYHYVILYNGTDKTLSVWVNDEIYFSNVPLLVNTSNIGLGIKVVKAKGTVKNIKIYKTSEDAEDDREDTPTQEAPVMPDGNTDYFEQATVNVERVAGAEYQNDVITVNNATAESWITLDGLTMSANDTFVYEMVINISEADAEWKGIRPALASAGFNDIMTVAPFNEILFLLKETGSAISVTDPDKLTYPISRQLNNDHKYQILYNGTDKTVSVWVDGVQIVNKTQLTVTTDNIAFGFKAEMAKGTVKDIRIYKTAIEPVEEEKPSRPVPAKPENARDYGETLRFVSDHLNTSGATFENGILRLAKAGGEQIISTTLAFNPKSSFVIEATINMEKQDASWKNIRMLLGVDGWKDFSSVSMFGREVFLFNENSLENIQFGSVESEYASVAYDQDYKLSLFYNGAERTVTVWVDDKEIYSDVPVNINASAINPGFKFCETAGYIKDIHIYKTASGLSGVPEYETYSFAVGYAPTSPYTGENEGTLLVAATVCACCAVLFIILVRHKIGRKGNFHEKR